jgi:uncharacterized protein (DUF342 family)
MSHPQDISVRVLDDGRRATVHIPAGFDAANLTPELLHACASEAHVQITAEVERALAAIINDYKASPRKIDAEFARATEPVHGTDGAWAWERQFDPAAAPAAQATDGTHTDFHASHIVCVASGTPVARMATPKGGTDGRTVTGAVISARPGHTATLHLGPGLQARPDGFVVATCDGVLRVSKGTVAVLPILEIKGCVDFTTGNIDFKGDVTVADTVRDGFLVRATGNITISGPVEGASIECHGSLTCPHGVASAHRGKILVHGNTSIRYLRNVDAVFKGDLTCRGEIEHSHILVGGATHCESGRVMGGTLLMTGTAHIGTIGSPEWAPTVVRVGDLPLVAMELRQLNTEAAHTQKAIAAKEESLHQTQAGGGKSASARERLTELQYELSELHRKLTEIETKRARLAEALHQVRGTELHVARVIYPRVRIEHGPAAYEFEKELKGPLQFVIDEHGAIQVRIATQNPRPITDFAHSVRAPHALPAPAEPARKCA